MDVVDVLVRLETPLYPPKLTANGVPGTLAVKTNCPEPAPLEVFTATEPLASIKLLRPFLMALAVLEVPSPKVNTSPLIAILWVPVAAPVTFIVLTCATSVRLALIPFGRPKTFHAVGLI